MKKMLDEFLEFIKKYGVIGLAIAVIIGGKLNTLVTSIVDGILMPILTFFIPGGAWRTATLQIGPVHLLLGPVLGATIDFLIVAGVIFLIAKFVLREDRVKHRPPANDKTMDEVDRTRKEMPTNEGG
jgi:large conductance mechanosensitive channel